MAISAALVRAMQGRIGYRPGPRGQGSVFWIELPLRVSPSPDQVEPDRMIPDGPAERHSSGAILVVDDMASNRLLVRAMLEQSGYEVRLAASGREAIEAVAHGDIGLVLMDVHMPDMDGFEVARRIRRLPGPEAQVPVLALTADALPEHVQACVNAGMRGHVSKPVERADLVFKIEQAIDTPVFVEGSAQAPLKLLG
ncbi:MAG: response regulator [Acetobacteraceae bacterium]|nr:response regulator [Acetobacteraceae bacterium]